MFDLTSLASSADYARSGLKETRPDVSAYQTALIIFDRIHRSACTAALFNRLLRRPVCLMDLDACKASLAVTGCHYAGFQPVLVSQIIGSEGRSCAFDRSFRPLQSFTEGRWVNICMLMLMHAPLPAVELVQVGDAYFVRDGNHRISVARALGIHCLDAKVIAWQAAGVLPWAQPAPARGWVQAFQR
jgi:hypothetical protein